MSLYYVTVLFIVLLDTTETTCVSIMPCINQVSTLFQCNVELFLTLEDDNKMTFVIREYFNI